MPSITANPNYVMRLGENPPVLTPATPAQAIAAPANGIVTTNSLYYQQGLGGYAVSANYHTPYVQNWNLTVSWQVNSSTSVELSYVGAKGTHLFLPHENVNFKNQSLLNAQIAANVNTTGTINDPLGRVIDAQTVRCDRGDDWRCAGTRAETSLGHSRGARPIRVVVAEARCERWR